jgi:hypothetical protein
VPGTATGLVAIRSADTVDGQVKTQDLALGAVTSKKVAYDSLGGHRRGHVGRVPNAARVGGLKVVKFSSSTMSPAA